MSLFLRHIFLPLQLQLQRNEVIALLNLLNRLSESVKYVHEKGPSVEKILGQVTEPALYEDSIWQRMCKWTFGIRYVLYHMRMLVLFVRV